jgi:hypothetical protein
MLAAACTAASLPPLVSITCRFDQLRLAFGDGAGLVERDGLELARSFEIRAALDEDAAPRGRVRRAHHRDGRGEHQRARAGDDQQHQRLVDGMRSTSSPCSSGGSTATARPARRRWACRPRRSLSTKRCVGAREACASSTAWMMRVERGVGRPPPSRGIRSSPVWLMVPANTGSPTPLSTGMLSPVTLAWSMALVPPVISPSSGTRSPGRMRTMAFRRRRVGHAAASCRRPASPRPVRAPAPSGRMALRARSTRELDELGQRIQAPSPSRLRATGR